MDEPVATRNEIRAFDKHAIETLGVPGIVLMENAGRQIADVARDMVREAGDRVVILAGKGNNGGDGFVVARHLTLDGVHARVFLLGQAEDVSGDAGTNLAILEALGIEVAEVPDDPSAAAEMLTPALAEADVVVDALLGTGARGEIREPYATAIQAINGAGAAGVLAIDIPSGLECDSGRPLGPTVRADRTVTMAAVKTGFREPEAKEFVGEVILADIGIPFEGLATDADAEEE